MLKRMLLQDFFQILEEEEPTLQSSDYYEKPAVQIQALEILLQEEQTSEIIIEQNPICFDTLVILQDKPRKEDQDDQSKSNLIEEWFHLSIMPTNYSLFQHLLAPHQSEQLVLHAQVHAKVFIVNPSMNLFTSLLRTCLHWNHTYT